MFLFSLTPARSISLACGDVRMCAVWHNSDTLLASPCHLEHSLSKPRPSMSLCLPARPLHLPQFLPSSLPLVEENSGRAGHLPQLQTLASLSILAVEVSLRLCCFVHRGRLDLLFLILVFFSLAMHQRSRNAPSSLTSAWSTQTSPPPSISFLSWTPGESIDSLAFQHLAKLVG